VWWHLLAQQGPEQFGPSSFIDELARTPLSKVIEFVAVCSVLRIALAPILFRTPVHLRGFWYKAGGFINEALDAIVYAGVFVFLLIRPFGVQAFQIPSGSMNDTLQENDFIVANKAIFRYTDPKPNDIVVFRPPLYAVTPKDIDSDGEVKVDFIKRTIGTPGDLIEIKSGIVYRNGVAQQEPFTRERSDVDFKLVYYKGEYWPLAMTGSGVNEGENTAPHFRLQDQREMAYVRELPAARIPKNHFLMMGDNRNQSFDGRFWGLIDRDEVIGRSEFIWFPVGRWRITR